MHKIVKFRDGRYGVRRGVWLFMIDSFADLHTRGLYWSIGTKYIDDCKGTLEQAQAAYDHITDYGTEV